MAVPGSARVIGIVQVPFLCLPTFHGHLSHLTEADREVWLWYKRAPKIDGSLKPDTHLPLLPLLRYGEGFPCGCEKPGHQYPIPFCLGLGPEWPTCAYNTVCALPSWAPLNSWVCGPGAWSSVRTAPGWGHIRFSILVSGNIYIHSYFVQQGDDICRG